MTTFLTRLSERFSQKLGSLTGTTRQLLIVTCWLSLALAIFSQAVGIEHKLSNATQIERSQSQRMDRLLSTEFSRATESLILVISGLPDPSGIEGRQVLKTVLDRIQKIENTGRVYSYLSSGDMLFVGERGAGSFAIVELKLGAAGNEITMSDLQRRSAKIEADVSRAYPQFELLWTGEAALNADLREWGAKNASEAELKALPVVGLLLILTFGSIISAGLTVVSGLLAVTIAIGVVASVASVFEISTLVLNIVTMVGLGISVDYALLTVSRFRDELKSGAAVANAADVTAHHARRTIAVSGLAVLVGFAAMLISPIGEIRSIAIGGIIVVAVVLAINTTLLPALLRLLGKRVNDRSIGWRPGALQTERFWRYWASLVIRHPVPILLVALAFLVALASPIRTMNVALPEISWLPAEAASVHAMNVLNDMGRGGVVNQIQLVLSLPPDQSADTENGWRAIAEFSVFLERDPRIAFVRSAAMVYQGNVPSFELYQSHTGDLAPNYLSANFRHALIEIVPSATASQSDLRDLSHWLLQAKLPPSVAPFGKTTVGGLPIFNAEYEDAIHQQLWMIIALVTLVTFLALAAWCRSLLVPLKAVLLSLFSVGAGLGGVVLVFQSGLFGAFVGIDQPTGAIFPIVPLLVFAITFGLSMDYEVFLVSRLLEARRQGLDDSKALAIALTGTGNIITSAALIMISVFGAFVLGEFLLVKMLGFALALTVFLDATIVRLGLGPAILILGGRWNWWPGERFPKTKQEKVNQP